MGLFSLFRKNKQALASGQAGFYSRAEEESKAVRGRSRHRPDKEAADPILPEKKRARRRLVGAMALVLAAVIVLPIILDSEPKPLVDDIAIDIPALDKPAATGMRAAPITPAPVSASQEEKTPTATLSQPVASENADATAAPNHEPVKHDPLTPDSAASAGHPPPSPVDLKNMAAVDKSKDAAHVKALEAKASSTHAEANKKAGKFIVQVAALASKDKISQLQARLKSAGIASYTQKVATESGDYVRIRVGPFSSKQEADKMRARLSKLGLSGTLIPPAEPHH